MISVMCLSGQSQLVFRGRTLNDIADSMRQSPMGAMNLRVYLDFLLLNIQQVTVAGGVVTFERTEVNEEDLECSNPSTSSDSCVPQETAKA